MDPVVSSAALAIIAAVFREPVAAVVAIIVRAECIVLLNLLAVIDVGNPSRVGHQPITIPVVTQSRGDCCRACPSATPVPSTTGVPDSAFAAASGPTPTDDQLRQQPALSDQRFSIVGSVNTSDERYRIGGISWQPIPERGQWSSLPPGDEQSAAKDRRALLNNWLRTRRAQRDRRPVQRPPWRCGRR
ncbi:hypothetical protein PBRA_007875 [Plasmodiophora brassicae]|uniref:Uncharacterized protein n=1 Tax=Plasmodiophora brassicae TaxID=37360 RepID=A0A0G4IYQ0_PLABS|nr:hypothetical protein PBRA_007875 [Plasmodiophora brassicae]